MSFTIKPMDVIFAGALLVIIGGIIGAIGTRMQNKSSSLKSDKQLKKIEDLNDQNSKLANSISELSSQNSKLATQLGLLGEQNTKLMGELLDARKDVDSARNESFDNIVGSKEVILKVASIGKSYHLAVYNDSQLPVYDAIIFISRYDDLLKCKIGKSNLGYVTIQAKCYYDATKEIKIPIIHGKTEMTIPDFPVDSDRPFKLSIKFITKKGTFFQQYFENGLNTTGYRILENHDNKLVVIKTKMLRGDKTDWEKEFPLPVTLQLVD